MGKNVLITGGTGLVGRAVSKLLESKGYNIAVLSRKKNVKGVKSFHWDYTKGIIDKKAIEFADVIIHLAGENISNKNWSTQQKEKIVESRVNTTELLFDAVRTSSKKVEAFISASAVGYYGSITSPKIFKENDLPGNDFLAQTVLQWENQVDMFNDISVRTVKLRFGVVLSKHGGALQKMLTPIKLGLGSPLGSGRQYIPWIEISDLAEMILFAVENENISSTYNAVSPEHITNSELTKKIAKHLNKGYFMPNVPSFILKMLFGKMSDIILKGSRVSSDKIQNEGFKFKYYKIDKLISTL
ncbi:MAG: TIGR01777 family oxidoreductase [Bacteroidota bacterium]